MYTYIKLVCRSVERLQAKLVKIKSQLTFNNTCIYIMF